MALKQQKQTKKPSPGLETQGPVDDDQGYNPSALPANPSDEIFMGKALPIIPAQEVTLRRPFSIPTKPTLHHADGLDGAAETVTVNERRFNAGVSDSPPYVPVADQQDWDHQEYGENPGVDKNQYSKNPNVAYTKNGVEIRGT
jgi:hypothetical protein